MFASTNLVIELGILILVFLGWAFLVTELIGGLVLIAISSLLIRTTYPRRWMERGREQAEEASPPEEDFDWRQRIRSRRGWRLVGHQFTAEWAMVWEEILIGFTVAGFVAVLVPSEFWEGAFLVDNRPGLPDWAIALENAAVAPFVAAATFIGSMGNIPLATVLNANGVLFAGIMGFTYSDLMVPPLVRVNAKYYGWPVALYIAAVMYVSIVATALILHPGFAFLEITPESERVVAEVVRFEMDYTFWLNLLLVAVAGWLVWLSRRHERLEGGPNPSSKGGYDLKRVVVILVVTLLLGGLVAAAISR